MARPVNVLIARDAVMEAKMISHPDFDRAPATAFWKGARDLMAWAGRRLWLAVRTVSRTAIRAARLAHHEQVSMWECVLLTSGVAPLSAAGPLRWVPSLGGHRLIGSHLPAPDLSETGR